MSLQITIHNDNFDEEFQGLSRTTQLLETPTNETVDKRGPAWDISLVGKSFKDGGKRKFITRDDLTNRTTLHKIMKKLKNLQNERESNRLTKKRVHFDK